MASCIGSALAPDTRPEIKRERVSSPKPVLQGRAGARRALRAEQLTQAERGRPSRLLARSGNAAMEPASIRARSKSPGRIAAKTKKPVRPGSSGRTQRGLTPRSTGPATASTVSPVRGTWCIIAHRAYGACLRRPVSSNVRPRKPPVSVLAVSWRNRVSSQFVGAAQERGPRAGHKVCGSNERGRRSASVCEAEPKAAPERGRCFEKARWRSGRESSSPDHRARVPSRLSQARPRQSPL